MMPKNQRLLILAVGSLLAFVVLLSLAPNMGEAQTPQEQADALATRDPVPYRFSGTATTVDGVDVPDGLSVVAKIDGGKYISEPVVVKNGWYERLILRPTDSSLSGKQVTFYLDGVLAQQTEIYIAYANPNDNVFKLDYPLVFPKLPEPTATPTLTPTLTATPTPEALPAVLSGIIAVAGMPVPGGAKLVVRVGSYESTPALIEGPTFSSLVVDPGHFSFIGNDIEFFLNGVRSSLTKTYLSGNDIQGINLVFVGLPTPTPTPTPIPTSTPTPIPTYTPIPVPTDSPSATPTPTIAPTLTPTLTPIPTILPSPTPTLEPSPTAIPTLEVPVESTPTPVASAGGCFAAVDAPLASGLANVLLLGAPVGLILGFSRRRRRNNRS